MNVERRTRIRALNDRLRKRHLGGRILISSGLMGQGPAAVAAALQGIQQFDAFDERNDPYGEHDFGSLSVEGRRIFWKIDYYDQTLKTHAADP